MRWPYKHLLVRTYMYCQVFQFNVDLLRHGKIPIELPLDNGLFSYRDYRSKIPVSFLSLLVPSQVTALITAISFLVR